MSPLPPANPLPGEDLNPAYYNAGVVEILTRNTSQAESGLSAAIQRAPNWYQPHWLLCRPLGQTGRAAEARGHCGLALNPLCTQREGLRRLIQQPQASWK